MLPQIDWQYVPAREAYYFGIALGGITMTFFCLFLHWWLATRWVQMTNKECDEAYENGYRTGRQDREMKRHLTAFLAVDHATRNPRAAFLE